MRRIETTIDIQASPDRVWAVLTDWGAYPAWNPLVRGITGKPALGERLRVQLQLPGSKRPMTVTPTVTAFEPDRQLAWIGRLGVPGLFDGNHVFDLEPIDGITRLHHYERFTGVMVPLLWPLLRDRTQAGFVAMNDALRQRAEASR